MPVSAEALHAWFEQLKGRDVNLEVGGRMFGGRPGEAPLYPKSATLNDDRLVIDFGGSVAMKLQHAFGAEERSEGGTELLEVVAPVGLFADASGAGISDAEAVTFGWHYYGRRLAPENWCTETYVFNGDEMAFTSTGPFISRPSTLRRNGSPAVYFLFWSAYLESLITT